MKRTQDTILNVFRSFFGGIDDALICFRDLVTFSKDRLKSFRATHGLRTSNEGKNQRNLKIRADVADSILGSAIKNMGLFSKIPIDFKIETMDF